MKFLTFDVSTGQFLWKVGRGRVRAGEYAGYPRADERVMITVAGIRCLATDLAWLMAYRTWPTGAVKHFNGDLSDNRIANLYLADEAIARLDVTVEANDSLVVEAAVQSLGTSSLFSGTTHQD